MGALKNVQALKAATLVFSIENQRAPTKAEIDARRDQLNAMSVGVLEHTGLLLFVVGVLSLSFTAVCIMTAAGSLGFLNLKQGLSLLLAAMAGAGVGYLGLTRAKRCETAVAWLAAAKSALRPWSEADPAAERLTEMQTLCALNTEAEAYRQAVIKQNREFYEVELQMFETEMARLRLLQEHSQQELAIDTISRQLYTP